jgi:hypothetical protein
MVNSYSIQFYNKNVKQKLDYLITLDEVKRHLRIDELETDNDESISFYLKASINYCENYINSDIALTKNVLTVKDFKGDRLRIDEGNLIIVSGLTGTSITYGVFDNIIDFNIYFDDYVSQTDLKIEYYSGFENSTLPDIVRNYIIIKTGDLFDNERGSYSPLSIKMNDLAAMFLGYYKEG